MQSLQTFAPSGEEMPLSNIEEVIDDIRKGKMVILVDVEARENEGDLAMAADAVTPEAINLGKTGASAWSCVRSLRRDEI